MQEVLLKLHRHRDRFRGDASLATWLHRVAVHEVRSRQRSVSRRLSRWWRYAIGQIGANEADLGLRRNPGPRRAPDEGAGPEGPSGAEPGTDPADERLDQLRAAVSRLPPPLREAVVLHHLEGHGVNESADLLGISPNACSLRLKRARERLRELLGSA